MIHNKFNIGDKVQVNFQNDRYLTCTIFALFFTELDVSYNLKVEGSDIELYSIASCFVEEYGQIKPNVYYKTEVIFDNFKTNESKLFKLNEDKLKKVREIANKYIKDFKLPEQLKNQDEHNKNIEQLNKIFKSD